MLCGFKSVKAGTISSSFSASHLKVTKINTPANLMHICFLLPRFLYKEIPLNLKGAFKWLPSVSYRT